MKLLLHVCCGPCAAYPLSLLQREGVFVRGFFYNPNIHPFLEFRKRLTAVEKLAAAVGLDVDYHREYGLRDYLRAVVFNENKRCALPRNRQKKLGPTPSVPPFSTAAIRTTS